VFLDRDGTLIEDADYLADPDGVVLIPGAVRALTRLRAAGWALVVVTNQSGIARGRFTADDYHRVADRLDRLLAAAGVAPEATLHCPHHPAHTGPCACRKPAPGMLVTAAAALGLDLSRSWIVGDKLSDLEAGARVATRGILVRTGYGRTDERGAPPGTAVVDSIDQAVDHILGSARAFR
jgi:D-glycero-D-manno-heptose 1,7-bisphosphate phosphatase